MKCAICHCDLPSDPAARFVAPRIDGLRSGRMCAMCARQYAQLGATVCRDIKPDDRGDGRVVRKEIR